MGLLGGPLLPARAETAPHPLDQECVEGRGVGNVGWRKGETRMGGRVWWGGMGGGDGKGEDVQGVRKLCEGRKGVWGKGEVEIRG